MPKVKTYHLPPTALIPNSPYPLLYYPGFLLPSKTPTNPSTPANISPVSTKDLFASNGWETQWIYRYGRTQRSHYHSAAHEVMAVLTGSAKIRFGIADISDTDMEDGGVEVEAHAGDVFVLPAGVAHKTASLEPVAEFKLLTPGDGHRIVPAGEEGEGEEEGMSESLAKVELSGFCMVGGYPKGGEWDFCVGGEHENNVSKVWAVAKPERDPVLGESEEGLVGLWR